MASGLSSRTSGNAYFPLYLAPPPHSDPSMAADSSDLFGSSEEWDAPHRGSSATAPSNTNYLGLSIPDLPTSHGRYAFGSELEQAKGSLGDSDDALEPLGGMLPAFAGFSHEGDGGQLTASPQFAPAQFAPPAPYISQAAFTPMNSRSASSQDSNTISPLQTRFDGSRSSLSSNLSFNTDSTMFSGLSSSFVSSEMPLGGENFTQKGRSNSLNTNRRSETPTIHSPKGRRRSENVEPGSARATYLEKNRKAASKCRTKQKKQQEELVEAARDMERRNKVLKAEVELLKGDMRQLMDIVGRHSDCPDTRLQTYVQREADRLIASGVKSPVAKLLVPRETGSASPEPRKGASD